MGPSLGCCSLKLPHPACLPLSTPHLEWLILGQDCTAELELSGKAPAGDGLNPGPSGCPEPQLLPHPPYVPQNTYTNADKLLEAAEQLAQTGECDPEEIYQAAHQLEDRIQDFVRRVEQRKILLDMSVSFHTHVKEVRMMPLPPTSILPLLPPPEAQHSTEGRRQSRCKVTQNISGLLSM